MPTGVALSQLVEDVRAEAGYSMNGLQNIANEAQLKYLVKRTEEELWIAHDWRMRLVNRKVALQDGQRYYDYPTDLPYDMVNQVYAENYTEWWPMEFGILPTDYSIYNSDNDVRTWPPRRWDHYEETGQWEIWPIPNMAGEVIMRGQKLLTPMVDDTDVCTLDSTLIVLSVATELLSRLNSGEVELKAQKLARHLQRLKGQQISHKSLPLKLTPPRGPQLKRNMVYVTTRPNGGGSQ